MKKCILLICSALILLSATFSYVHADADYRFQVTEAIVNLYYLDDGTVSIEYTYTFVNDENAHVIDYVDIGLPNSSYRISNIQAEIDGKNISTIESSPVVSPGIALNLGSNAIQPGSSGTVHVMINGITGLLYSSTEDNEGVAFTSSKISPNWFDSDYAHGSTNYTVTIYLPAGLDENQGIYYYPENWPGEREPFSRIDDQERIFYRWQSDTANIYTQYIFGSGFPQSMVPTQSVNLAAAASSSSGSATGSDFFSNIPDFACCMAPASFFILLMGFSIFQGQKRKMKYLPPKISIEGHGVKRGLTAIEAAILLEQPMDKILTLILFSVIKKNAATVIQKEPLTLNISEPIAEESLRAYEVGFLKAFKLNETARRKAIQELMIDLINSVSEKMKGFSFKETVQYYTSIVDKAWQYVGEAGTPDVKVQRMDEAFDWTLLDGKFSERSNRTFGQGPVFMPSWWFRFDPVFHHHGHPVTPSSIPQPTSTPSMSLPNLPGSEFAASVVNNIQTFSSNVIGNLTSFTNTITNKTNPVPAGYSSGGRGCACACACAGCACACAGGGR